MQLPGAQYATANVSDSSLAEIWHDSAGFRAIRALRHSEPASQHGNTATFAAAAVPVPSS